MWASRRSELVHIFDVLTLIVMDLTVTVVESHCHLSLGKFRSSTYADDPRLLVVLNAFVLQDMGVYRHWRSPTPWETYYA